MNGQVIKNIAPANAELYKGKAENINVIVMASSLELSSQTSANQILFQFYYV